MFLSQILEVSVVTLCPQKQTLEQENPSCHRLPEMRRKEPVPEDSSCSPLGITRRASLVSTRNEGGYGHCSVGEMGPDPSGKPSQMRFRAPC